MSRRTCGNASGRPSSSGFLPQRSTSTGPVVLRRTRWHGSTWPTGRHRRGIRRDLGRAEESDTVEGPVGVPDHYPVGRRGRTTPPQYSPGCRGGGAPPDLGRGLVPPRKLGTKGKGNLPHGGLARGGPKRPLIARSPCDSFERVVRGRDFGPRGSTPTVPFRGPMGGSGLGTPSGRTGWEGSAEPSMSPLQSALFKVGRFRGPVGKFG